MLNFDQTTGVSVSTWMEEGLEFSDGDLIEFMSSTFIETSTLKELKITRGYNGESLLRRIIFSLAKVGYINEFFIQTFLGIRRVD